MSSEGDSGADRTDEILQRHREAAEAVVPADTGVFVGGEFREAASGETFATTDPTTGEVLAEVAAGGPEDVDAAVGAAWEAYDAEWSGYDPARRQSVLHELADAVEERADEFARLEALDNGKPVREAKGDVYQAVDHFRYFAGAARHHEGIALPADDTRSLHTVEEPFGVVGAVVPWNFPLLIATWKLAPALAAGNAVVLKPAEQTPLSALKLAGVAADVLPDGVLNVVPGFGEDAGAPLTEHPDVPKVAFTGSTAVGKQVMRAAADRVADVTLELGGKNPFVVFPDADLEAAARNAFLAIFYNKGETCTAGSRMFVHEEVYEEFLDSLVAMAEDTEPADPLTEGASFGPKVSHEQVERVEGYVDVAREEGATVLTGGGRPDDPALADGAFYEPTIIEGLDHDSAAVQEEIFGPVLAVFEWDDYEAMIDLANDVDFGLAAGVMAGDTERAMRAARDIEAGTVWVNQYQDFPAGMPFGGVKESGIGRETAAETMDAYTRTKSVNVSLR